MKTNILDSFAVDNLHCISTHIFNTSHGILIVILIFSYYE